jgi:hypothetical protein
VQFGSASCVSLTASSSICPERHYSAGLCSRTCQCLLCGAKWNFEHNLDEFKPERVSQALCLMSPICTTAMWSVLPIRSGVCGVYIALVVPLTSSRRAFTVDGYITQVQFYHKPALSSTQLLSRLCGLDVALPDGSDVNIGKLLYCTFLAVFSIQH